MEAVVQREHNDGSPTPNGTPCSAFPQRRRRRTNSFSDTSWAPPIVQTTFTRGRPPWFSSAGASSPHPPMVIGITGGSASGKTTVARKIIENINVKWVTLISLDSFYKVLDADELKKAHANEYDFDSPQSFDYDLAVKTLRRLKSGKKCEIPIYDFSTHSRSDETITVYGSSVIIFEGILTLVKKEIRDEMDLTIFVDEDSDVRLARRLKRDISERGRDALGCLKQYEKFVKPSFEQFIEPCKFNADLIMPHGATNPVNMEILFNLVRNRLNIHFPLRKALSQQETEPGLPPDGVHLLEAAPVEKIIELLNKRCERKKFVHHATRLMRLAIEKAVSLLPHENVLIKTGENTHQGRRFRGRITGVVIMRAGCAMEGPLISVCKDAKIGKVLIQTDTASGEPNLHYLKIPRDIHDSHVFILDPVIKSGSAALMGIRILLDHDVPPERVIFVCLMATRRGLNSILYAFPKIRVVVASVQDLKAGFNFGDHFYGTSTLRQQQNGGAPKDQAGQGAGEPR